MHHEGYGSIPLLIVDESIRGCGFGRSEGLFQFLGAPSRLRFLSDIGLGRSSCGVRNQTAEESFFDFWLPGTSRRTGEVDSTLASPKLKWIMPLYQSQTEV